MNLNTQNIDTTNRKPLVRALVELLAQPPVYAGPPTYSYKVGDYTITRRGDVIVPDDASEETIQWLKEKLEDKGFSFDDDDEQPQTQEESSDADPAEDESESVPEPDISNEGTQDTDTDDEPSFDAAPDADEDSDEESNLIQEDTDETGPADEEPDAEEPDAADTDEDEDDSDADEADSDEDEAESETEESSPEEAAEDTSPAEAPKEPETPDDGKSHITLALPRCQFTFSAIDRLKAIVASKQTLLKKALDTDTLEIQLTDDKVLFPWFTDHGLTGELDAYSKLVFAIAKLAINQKRASAEEKQNDNEKLAMRLFLVRLGLSGDENRTARAILTRNFTGNSAWKNGPNGTASGITLSAPEVYHPAAATAADPAKEEADE